MAKLINKGRIAEAVKKAKTKVELYHGTSEGTDFYSYDPTKANTGVGANVWNQGNRFYLTESEKAARYFANEANRLKTMRETGTAKSGGNVLKFYLNDDAKVLDVEDMPAFDIDKAEKIINDAKENGYDAVRFPEKGLEGIEGSRDVYESINEIGRLPKTTVILNQNAVKRIDSGPMKRNSPNLLASAGAGIGAGVLYTPEENQAQASMIGQAAKTFNKEALKYAEQLEKQGAPMEAIRRMTGYQFGTPIHRGVDGKWRQEISDLPLEINPEIDKSFTYGIKRIPKKSGDVNEAIQLEKEGYSDKAIFKLTGLNKQDGNWVDFRTDADKIEAIPYVEHYGIAEAYPESSDIRVSIRPETFESGGYFDPAKNEIVMNKRKESGEIPYSETRSGFAHELQHYIQEREGFARGGNPREFDRQKEAELYRDAKGWRMELERARKEYPNEDNAFLNSVVIDKYIKNDLAEFIPSLEARNIALNDNFLRDDIQEEVNNLISTYGLNKRTTPYSGRDVYRKLAGEEEARQTQKRLGLTMKERIDRDPRLDFDTPPEQQIVIGAQKGNADPRLLAGLGLGAGVAMAASELTTRQKAERARLSRMTRKQQLADVTKRALGGLSEIPGDLAKYAHDVANFGAGIFSTADLLGGAAAIPYEMTGNLDAYRRDVQPYVQQASETQSEGFKRLEDIAGKGIETAITATAPAWYPAYQQWSPIIGNAMEDFYYPNADLYDR